MSTEPRGSSRRILYVYDGNWPRGATRVLKQTRSFAEAGHDVLLVCRNTDRAPRAEQADWMTIRRLPSLSSPRLNYLINFPFFLNPVWLYAIWSAARDWKADCIVVADLPLAPTALWVGQLLGLPVHYDMAEVYPEFLRSQWQYESRAWTDHFVRNPKAAEVIERYVLGRVDTIFVVSEESRERCVRLGVEDHRLVMVGNTPPDHQVDAPIPEYPDAMLPWKDRLRVLFVGTLIGDRGVNEAVEAMAMVRRTHPDSVLVIVGDGPETPRLKATVARLGLEEHVAFLGWRAHETLPGFYAHAHLGLLPFQDGHHVRLTLANKLFDYMAAGLPCVAADLPPMRRILTETRAGILHPAGDVPRLATAISVLLGDDAARRTFSLRARYAARAKYRWSKDEARLLAAVEPASEVPVRLPTIRHDRSVSAEADAQSRGKAAAS